MSGVKSDEFSQMRNYKPSDSKAEMREFKYEVNDFSQEERESRHQY
jgi:hypothetical protein